MKKRNYVVTVSMIALLIQSSGIGAMEKKEAVAAKIDALEQNARTILSELGELRKCYPAGTCSKDRYARLRSLGKKVAIGIAAVAGAAVVAGGIAFFHGRSKPTVENAARERNVDLTDLRAKELLSAFASNDMGEIKTVINKALANPARYSENAVRGAVWLVDTHKNRDAYNQLIQLWNVKFPAHKKEPLKW